MGIPSRGGVVEHNSPLQFDATVKRLSEAIQAAGLTIFASVDHAENARVVGMSMPPATVIIYGNGKGGTPIMLSEPQAALDLPLRVLVQDRGGRVVVAFHPIAEQLEQIGVPKDSAARLEPAQKLIVKALDSEVA